MNNVHFFSTLWHRKAFSAYLLVTRRMHSTVETMHLPTLYYYRNQCHCNPIPCTTQIAMITMHVNRARCRNNNNKFEKEKHLFCHVSFRFAYYSFQFTFAIFFFILFFPICVCQSPSFNARYIHPVSVSFHLNPYTNKRAQHSSTTRALHIHSNRHSIHSVSEVTLRIDRHTGRHSTLFPLPLSHSVSLDSFIHAIAWYPVAAQHIDWRKIFVYFDFCRIIINTHIRVKSGVFLLRLFLSH